MCRFVRATFASVCLVWALPTLATAQAVDVGISGTGLLSFQPVDDFYVGGPYLSQGAGGVAPGFGVGVNAMFPAGLVVAGELTMAFFAVEQSGRLVPGPRPPGPGGSSVGGSGTTHLHDTLLSVMLGYAQRTGGTHALFLVGAAALLDDPSTNGTTSEHDTHFPILTGGVDVIRSLSPQLSLGLMTRVAYIGRPEVVRLLGIGPWVLRGGAVLRVRLN